jgi:nitrate reductase beta subunit
VLQLLKLSSSSSHFLILFNQLLVFYFYSQYHLTNCVTGCPSTSFHKYPFIQYGRIDKNHCYLYLSPLKKIHFNHKSQFNTIVSSVLNIKVIQSCSIVITMEQKYNGRIVANFDSLIQITTINDDILKKLYFNHLITKELLQKLVTT